ncbi:ATP-dependent dethiobiotin synthetase BioD [Candidatus Profftella armatura (Diaphorina cf. continua)]|uniref:ATP-dependent dethiobiotin synthetase BioD n=1 Tax=Candidatus Profftella armatura (Diaphorina cf. continua) TaxID=2661583 RepID=A0A7R6W0E2_9PROT|nr:dethiobiotin synthase [Candidatus Profftella armatura (Diaphorina cf. continua)]BCG49512.1 ATP-dependent dethiobiotin synthetase BioD [Candidatus Profftella armatura (Diaphorina cf. continua)]
MINKNFLHYFITGTNTNIGKTIISCALLSEFKKRGISCIGMKPVASGAYFNNKNKIWINEDINLLNKYSNNLYSFTKLINPYLFKYPISPYTSSNLENRIINISHIINCYNYLSNLTDVIILEGIGGFSVPFNDHENSADLAEKLGLPVILVIDLKIGCINHALLSVEAINSRGLKLIGWVANNIQMVDTLFSNENYIELTKYLNVTSFGKIPYLYNLNINLIAHYLDFSSLF